MILTSIWFISSVLLFLPGFIDSGKLSDVSGTTATVLVFILIPGSLLGISILKIKEPVTAIIVGAALLAAVIMPLHAFLAIFQLGWLLQFLILLLTVYALYKERDFLKQKSL